MLEFKLYGLGFQVWVLTVRLETFKGFMVYGLGFCISGWAFRVLGFGILILRIQV